MGNKKKQIKIDEEVHKKLKKLKNLEEFNLEREVTLSELINEMMKKEFKRYDGKIVTPIN